MSLTAFAEARQVLAAVGYGQDLIEAEYPVWLGPGRGVARIDLVAFGRAEPKDMSTALVTVTAESVPLAFEAARVVAAPFFMVAGEEGLDLWVVESEAPRRWWTSVSVEDATHLGDWLRPAAALALKVGLRQLPLFDLPVNLLASARSRSADTLGPIVGEALEAASEALPRSRNADAAHARRLSHRRAARLVVGALTMLVMRDRESAPRASGSLIEQAVTGHPDTFKWLRTAPRLELAVLESLVDQLGTGIDYKSLDPGILSEVYEQALVDHDDRQRLGIYYTPPRLASRLLDQLPVELVPPDERHVLDPSCGSGTLLVAAHDRLRALQPNSWTEELRHRDLAVHLHGGDIDPFAVEIARLTLLLHAQPAGNGWHVELRDAMHQRPSHAPRIIVTNPPWRFTAEGRREQAADAFVIRCMELLHPGGLLGILLPGSWISSSSSARTRAALVDQFDVFEVWKLPEGTFPTSQQAAVALLARKRDGSGGKGGRVTREVDGPNLPRFLSGSPVPVTYWVPDSQVPLDHGAPEPRVRTSFTRLDAVADIRSGPQPLPGIRDRGAGTPYISKFTLVAPYGAVSEEVLWHVAFPEDFQRPRALSIIGRKKVLASAARNSRSPWRFRVALDRLGIAMSNSVRGIAPHDQHDDDLLHAIMVVVGSGFASAFAASFGGDRNITARVLPSLPIPTSRSALRRLGNLGREAAALSDDPRALNQHLSKAERVIWDLYEVDDADRERALVRLGGHLAPEGAPRYPSIPPPEPTSESRFRRVGAVLDVADRQLRIWINGVTDEAGVVTALPAQMPGWLARGGATFDVVGVETQADIATGQYRFQPAAWADLDFDRLDPKAIPSS